MRVMITGGAGFIGSHLCDALAARGDMILCVDNLSTGTIANVRHLLQRPRFEFIRADVATELTAHEQVDVVAHLASPASPAYYLSRPLPTLTAGSIGTSNILELAHRWGARFVLASTSEIYGDPIVHPQSEDYHGNVDPIGPRSAYSESKRFAEALTCAYRRTYGLNVGIVRIFNTYGPRMPIGDGRVVTNFITQALTGMPLTVYGDGHNTRSFCYIDDLIRGLVAMIDCSEFGPINLGNPEEISIAGFARLVLEITESASRVTHRPLPMDDPARRKPQVSRAKELLGWAPEVGIREGIRHTVEWFRSRILRLDTRARTQLFEGLGFQ